jgi:hypothetical protein
MARPRTITEDKKLLIALMHTERHMTKKDIASDLKISASAVTKVIQECFAEGRLRLVFNRDGLSARQLDSLQTMVTGAGDLRRRLAAMRKDPAAAVENPEVRVFDSGSGETTQAAWASRLEVFGRAAAPYLGDLISNSRVVGTSWGETFASVVRALAERPPLRPGRPIQFFGLCGEMLQGPPRKVSASSLAHELDLTVNADSAHSHSYWLAGVPSRLPHPARNKQEGLTAAECEAVRRYINLLPGYRKVFGANPEGPQAKGAEVPLIDRADLILTSCGPKERPLGYGGVQELNAAGLSLSEARHMLVGDISGYLLKNPEIEDREGRIEAINRQLVSVNLLERLRNCSRKARDGRAAGTVLCCIGANKADTVLEIVRLGLVAKIVVDLDLASEMLRRV